MENKIRFIQPDDYSAASNLLMEVFMEFNATYCSEEGVQKFAEIASENALKERMEEGSIILVSEDENKLTGLIELTKNSHVKMLYVISQKHGTGLGRKLLDKMFSLVREKHPEIQAITLNSAPNALAFYIKYGFEATSGLIEKEGLSYIPMEMRID